MGGHTDRGPSVFTLALQFFAEAMLTLALLLVLIKLHPVFHKNMRVSRCQLLL